MHINNMKHRQSSWIIGSSNSFMQQMRIFNQSHQYSLLLKKHIFQALAASIVQPTAMMSTLDLYQSLISAAIKFDSCAFLNT